MLNIVPEGDNEEVKQGKGIKFVSPAKLLIRLPVLVAQVIHTN